MKKDKKTKKKKTDLSRGWKILFKYLFEYRKQVIFLSVLGVISAVANGTVPYLIGRFFDAVLDPSAAVFIGSALEMPLWLLFIIIFATVQIIADVVDWINSIERSWIGTDVHGRYLARAHSYLLKLPVPFHVNRKIGEVRENINMAGNAMTNIIEQVVISLAPQFLSIAIGVAIAFAINWVLGTVLIAGVLVYLITLSKVVAPIAEFTRKGNKAWGRAYGYSWDANANIFSVKKFTAEEYESKNIHKKFVDIAARLWHKVEKIWSNISFYQRVIVTVTRVLIFVLSVGMIQKGIISIGELIALNGYAAMVFGPFVTLGMNWQTIQNGLVRIEEAEKVLTMPTEDYTPKDAAPLKDLRGDIEFRGVNFYYKKKDGDILKDINFKVSAGETVALVGESGVGKSTLIDLISGYYFAQKGKVLVDGTDVKKINLNLLRKNIAVVPQEVALFNNTIKINIKYGSFRASDEKVKQAAEQAHADMFIEKFPKKYEQVVGERGIKLSVGQKQRVAIARAILRDPKILILDEPTSALDPRIERLITDSLKELMHGRTTFIIAHRLSTVRQADKILVFKEGRIIEEGNHEELMNVKDGEYQRLYRMHVGLQ
jgi:ATP-binding cassette subfamily B protein